MSERKCLRTHDGFTRHKDCEVFKDGVVTYPPEDTLVFIPNAEWDADRTFFEELGARTRFLAEERP